MKARNLLLATAALEVGAGVGLLAAPGLVTRLLGAASEGAGLLPARLAGAALLSLGVACWVERDAEAVPRGLVTGLLAYNALVPLVLVPTMFANGTHTAMGWSACATHTALAAWCALVLRGA